MTNINRQKLGKHAKHRPEKGTQLIPSLLRVLHPTPFPCYDKVWHPALGAQGA